MLKKYLAKLSTKQLYVFTAGAFALFLLDGVIPDPIPLVDEAALLYATLQGLRMVAARRGTVTQQLTQNVATAEQV